MKIWVIILGPLFAILCSSMALAQETVDVEKITREQFLLGQIADSRSVSIWVSGYYNGLRKNSVVDITAMQKNARDLIQFCLSNTGMPVMDAFKNVLGEKK